jgi:hypothetical protein
MRSVAPFLSVQAEEELDHLRAGRRIEIPVGSSAKSSRGRLTKARAMATRCCSPPESCFGSD